MSTAVRKFVKGQRVFRHYTAEPAYIYGGGRVREDGEILGDPVEYKGSLWYPVKWQYSMHPDLSSEGSINPAEEKA